MSIPDIDISLLLWNLLQLFIAYALALPIAWNREKKARSAGLRTFPLVSIGACGFMLVGLSALSDPNALGRVIYGIITGIGFIGGGAILKDGGDVRGTATAASIWSTGAIGVAVAWSRYEIAIALALVNFLTFQFVSPLKKEVNHDHSQEGDA